MFEKFSLPIWVHVSGDTSAAVDFTLYHYIPSPAAITHVTEAVQCKQTPDTWGQPDNSVWGRSEDNAQSVLNWDDSILGWGQNSGAQPVSDTEVRRRLQGILCMAPSGEQEERGDRDASSTAVASEPRAAMNHSIPGKSSTVVVFEWHNDEFGGFRQCICLTKAEIPMTWMSYSKSTRVYDSFCNKWDLCNALDLTSIPDGDWEEDDFLPVSAPSEPTPAPC
ncbi:hypothetical protein EDB19DRAFT_1915559 [Suillus lakei]|nr:hypothetical protein EDB19DRAFT_1915559 [Suillus lakei]